MSRPLYSTESLSDLTRQIKGGLLGDSFHLDGSFDGFGGDINDQYFGEFCNALQHVPAPIRKLSVDLPNDPSDWYLKFVEEVFTRLESVEILQLRPKSIEGPGFLKLLQALPAESASRLKSLHIACSFSYHNFQSYHDHEITSLCSWLESTFASPNRTCFLLSFELDGYRVHSHRLLFRTLQKLSTLQSISLHGMQAYLDGRRDAAAECQSLEDLLHMPSFDSMEISGLIFAPCHSVVLAKSLCEIQNLSVSNCRFSESGHVLGEALVKCEKLRSLTITPSRTGPSREDSLIHLESIPECLETLHFSNTDLSEHFLKGMAERLMSTKCRLQEFTIDSCSASLGGIEDFFMSLRSNKTLQDLAIRNMDLGDPRIAATLARSLDENRTLQSLSLNACSLSNDSLNLIVDSVVAHESVRKLNLSHHTGVTNDVIMSNTTRLLKCKSVKSMDLSGVIGDPLSESEGRTVLDLLHTNYDVENLVIDVESKCVVLQIGTLMRLNKAGRRYLNSNHSSREAAVSVLSKVISNVNDVFTHLQENPCICSNR